jgi:hypothetical protein
MDPVGLAMENFDSAGGFRATENDAPIDDRGRDRRHAKFNDAIGFTQGGARPPGSARVCLVNQAVLVRQSVGRRTKDEAEWLNYQVKQFAA